MEMEIALEKAHTRPLSDMKKRVQISRDANGRVIFISDMYLPLPVICELLDQHGFLGPYDAIYVSSQVRLTKHTGNLFRHVLSREGISPSGLVHVGDNLYADVEVPRRIGINAIHYSEIGMTRHERRLLRLARRNTGEAALVVSKLAGVSRIARHRQQANLPSALVSLFSGVIAPLLFAFTAWTINDAISRNKKKLYFVARDGQVLHKIASIIQKYHSQPIETEYLYGSRNAWFLPSATKIDRAELYWAWFSGMSRAPKDILRRLGFSGSEIVEVLARAPGVWTPERALTSAELEAFIQRVIEHPKVRDLIAEKARAKRQLMLRYLGQKGMLDGTPWAIVDIGWTLNCQYALEKVIHTHKRDQRVAGYYFGVVKENQYTRRNESGDFRVFASQSGAAFESEFTCDWIFHLPTIVLIEHLLVGATHATVTGYAETSHGVEPIFKENSNAPDHYRFVANIHDLILNAIIEYCKVGLHEQPESIREIAELALSEFKRFCFSPTREEAMSVARVPTNIEQSHDSEHTRTLAGPLTFQDLVGMIAQEILPHAWPASLGNRHAWPAGSAAISHPIMSVFFKALFYANRGRKRLTKCFSKH